MEVEMFIFYKKCLFEVFIYKFLYFFSILILVREFVWDIM